MDFLPVKEFMNRLTAWRMPGNSVSVYLKGKEVFRYSSGYADYENQVPMQGEELLNIYSCSKPVTVTAALQLFEKGCFLLDDPLYDFIPEFRHVAVMQGDGTLCEAKNPITLRHLFTMTSGLTYNSNTAAFEKARKLTGGKMDTLAVVRLIAEDPLSFEPGENWQYSLSHDVLAGVVETVSGKRFSRYVAEHIFEPLGICGATYHHEAVEHLMAEQYLFKSGTADDVVSLQMSAGDKEGGYLVNAGKGNTLIFGENYDSGGAGITVSVPEFAKFASALSCGGVGATGERILSERCVDLLRTNQLSEKQRKLFSTGKFRGYGYGLGVRTMMNQAESGLLCPVGEFGWGGAAGANLVVIPEMELAAFYAHHMLNPFEDYYQPRLINALCGSL